MPAPTDFSTTCPVDQVRDFEAELYKYVDATNPGLLRTIMEKKILDDNLKAEMTKVIKECKETFVAERQAVAKSKLLAVSHWLLAPSLEPMKLSAERAKLRAKS